MDFGLRMLALKEGKILDTNNTSMTLQMVNSTSKLEERLNVSKIIGSPLKFSRNVSTKSVTSEIGKLSISQQYSHSPTSTPKPQSRKVAAKNSSKNPNFIKN